MKNKDDGGPAFPRIVVDENNVIQSWTIQHGMTLRDWFAGQALAGLLANSSEVRLSPHEVEMTTGAMFSRRAYQYADAMLAERSKP